MKALELPIHRDVCWVCRRPTRVCWCGDVTRIESRTKVAFIQHPRESKVGVSTCRMAHRSLPGSSLHVTAFPEEVAALQAIAAAPGTAVLFPAPDAVDASELETPPSTLIVVDGTWDNAKKLLTRSPLFKGLPKIGLTPSKPGNYRIRKEPKAHCLSTIEAVVEVLETLEKAPGKFRPLIRTFDAMVDRQLHFIEGRVGASRHLKDRRADGLSSAEGQLKDLAARLVLVATESNAWPHGEGPGGLAELLQLEAVRVATGERFQAFLKPKRALSPSATLHLGVDPARFLDGEGRAQALARWAAFVREGEVLVSWGRHTLDLLRGESLATDPHEDLKAVVSRVWSPRPGGVESCAQALGGRLVETSRAGRRLEALEVVTRAVIAGDVRRVGREWKQAAEAH